MKRLIFLIVVGTIAATSEAALADLPLQPELGKSNPQLTKPVSIPGESPPQLQKEEIEIPQVELLKLEVSQQLPSDYLINRTLRFEKFGVE